MHRTVIRLAACAGLLLVAGTACGTGGGEDDSTAGAPPTSASANGSVPAPTDGPTITLKLIAFKPANLQTTAGSTVTWRQDDVASHTVTSGRVEQTGGTATAKPDGRFDSGTISKGQTFQFSFAEAGEYPFYCAIHPATMTGVVTVT